MTEEEMLLERAQESLKAARLLNQENIPMISEEYVNGHHWQ